MNGFVYVISLVGKHVFHENSTMYAINTIEDLYKVRAKLKEIYNLEFESYPFPRCTDCIKFKNITDNRDITLVVELVDVL